MSSSFLPAFLVGSGLLALWIDARFPGLAPASFSRRVLAACLACAALQVTPFAAGSASAAYASIFAFLLPAMVATLLTAVWLLRAVRDAQTAA